MKQLSSLFTSLISLLIFCSCACEKEQMPEIKIENVGVATPTSNDTPAKKIETVVLNYNDFPKNADGKEIWVKKVKSGKADITVIEDSELKTKVLNVKSDDASFYFQKKVDIDLKKYEVVSWKWKVITNPKGGDVRKSATDDQAIQVIFAFEGKYLISYVWDPTAPVGYSKDSSIPFLVAQKILVLESGETNVNKWMEIRRDIKADFKKLYKKDAPKLVGVAVQANSQHTDTKCEALLSPVTFETK
jgi:hypothetical protein